LRRVCERIPLRKAVVSSPEHFGGCLEQFVLNNDFDLVSYINADQASVSSLTMPFRAVHVVRDPRDVLVSAYFSHLHSHPTTRWPELVEFRSRLAGLNTKDGLLAELDFISELPTNGYNLRPFRSMMEWNYADSRILELKFEDMVTDPDSFFRRMACHLLLSGTPLAVYVSRIKRKLVGTPRLLEDGEVLDIVGRRTFTKLSGQSHHYRKGEPGEWRDYFDKDIALEFERRFPGLLQQLGYESDTRWAESLTPA
jgi:hypothetical protein